MKKILVYYTLSWVFQKCFFFVPMIESRNVDHIKSDCSWDKFLWKKSGGLHSFMSFPKYFSFVPMLESRNVDHVKRNCSRDMFLWKNSGTLHTFMSFSKIFQLCTHARITKYGSHQKWLLVRHVFVKKFWRTSQFHELSKNISNLYPC